MRRPDVVLDPARLHQALGEKMASRIKTGDDYYCGPAVPSLAGPTVALISLLVPEGLHGTFRDDLRNLILEQILPTWAQTPNGQIEVRWSGEPGSRYFEAWSWMTTLESAYASWNDEEVSRFGVFPDARVVTLLEEDKLAGPVLDLGAGDGRNSKYLAGKGLPVLAIELSPEAAAALRQASVNLPIEVIHGSVVDPEVVIPEGVFGTVLASGLTPHLRDTATMRRLFERAAQALRPGGRFVVDVFLAHPGWTPDQLAREVAQVCWTSFVTTDDARSLLAGLPFDLECTEDASTFEAGQARWGAEAPWWHSQWAAGLDFLALDPETESSPVRLMWWVFVRR